MMMDYPIVVSGNFPSVNGSSDPGYGLARLDAGTGALLPLPVNSEAPVVTSSISRPDCRLSLSEVLIGVGCACVRS